MGIISTKAHTVIGLVVGFVLVLAPYIFNFTDNEAASATAMWVGIFIIISELITRSPFSPLKLVPMKTHIVIDVLTGLLLVLSPWIFDFMNADLNNQWVPHVIVGVLVMGYALLTNTNDQSRSDIDRV